MTALAAPPVAPSDRWTKATCSMCGRVLTVPKRVLARQPHPVCPTCKPPVAPPPAESKMDQWQRLCRLWGVNPELAKVSQLPPAAEAARRAILQAHRKISDGQPAWVLFYGATGTGKTTAAFGLLSMLVGAGVLDMHHDVRIANEAGLIGPVTVERNGFVSTLPADPTPALAGRRLLLLDELGRTDFVRPAAGVQARLDLLNHMVARSISGIFTTNVPLDKLPEALGDRAVAERLIAMSETPVPVAETSLRRGVDVLNHR